MTQSLAISAITKESSSAISDEDSIISTMIVLMFLHDKIDDDSGSYSI